MRGNDKNLDRSEIRRASLKGKSVKTIKRITLLVLLVLLLSGCTWFEDKRIAVKPTIDPNSPEYRAVIMFLLENEAGNFWRTKESMSVIEYIKYLKREVKQ